MNNKTENLMHPSDAIKIIESEKKTPQTETVPLVKAIGRIIPNTIIGTIDQPPFDKAAMDGWAYIAEKNIYDQEKLLKIRGTIAAGDNSQKAIANSPIKNDEAVRIMTGARLPEFDIDNSTEEVRVHRIEWSCQCDENKNPTVDGAFVQFTKPESISNVIKKGINSKKGEVLLSPRMLEAQDIAILAADGQKDVTVSKTINVSVLSTGTELKEAGTELIGSQIYDSNRPQLITQINCPAFVVKDCGKLKDNYEETLSAIKTALASCNVLILSGGVSMGDYDYVPKALKEAGINQVFHKLAMKPGKPTWFGSDGEHYVFGLPGNPVSVFVNTEVMVKPLLYALSGIEYKPLIVPVPMAETIKRKNTERVEYLPVRITNDGVYSVSYHGSSGIQSLSEASGFIQMEIGVGSIEKGIITDVRLVR